MLEAITMVYVPVNNSNSEKIIDVKYGQSLLFQSMGFLRMANSQSDVIEEAEAHALVAFRMVTGWSDHGHAMQRLQVAIKFYKKMS